MTYLEHIDLLLFHAINGRAGLNETLDLAVMFVAISYAVKGLPVLMIWWGLWFSDTGPAERIRAQLLATLVVSIAAIFVGRILALTLPFRPRPIHHPDVAASLPAGVTELALDNWNSFPSDHAVMFFALAACILMIHRGWGLLLLLHAALIISLPRIYAGFHYPTDIAAGALIGMAMAVLLMHIATRLVARTGVLRLEAAYGYLFYPIVFFVTFQAASMFDSSRDLLRVVYQLARRLVA